MNNDQSKFDQVLQLKQMIIFLKSEVAKYENEIRELKKNDYYSLASQLEEENFEMKKQEKQLSLELLKLKRDFEKEISALQNEILAYKEKNEKLIDSIQNLVKEKNNLKEENIRLSTMFEQNVALTPIPVPDIEQFFDDFSNKIGQHLQHLQEKITENQMKLHQHVLEEVENKSNQIKQLLNTMEELKISASPSSIASMNATLLSHLDNQIQLIYGKIGNFEKQLEEKILLLDTIEQQLIELTNDLEE